MRIAMLAAAMAVAPLVAVAQPAPGPTELADKFFGALQSGDVAGAYRGIWGGTFMDKKQADVENVVAQNTTTLRTFGKVTGWEMMSEKVISPSLVERLYVLKTVNIPLFYKI